LVLSLASLSLQQKTKDTPLSMQMPFRHPHLHTPLAFSSRKLERLVQLKTCGALTEEEFALAKVRKLSKWLTQ
jgi:hypothetical protein